jgi:hypothetical protein
VKLKFYKDEIKNRVSILTKEETELEFDYVEMIKQIYTDKSIDQPEVSDEFSEEEQESIQSLITDISDSIQSLFGTETEAEPDTTIEEI